MNMDKAKEIIGNFIKKESSEISSNTIIDKSVIKGSVLIHRMYSLLSVEGYSVKEKYSIKTYGDFLNRLNNTNLISGHHDKDINKSEMSRICIPTSNILCGIDIEDISNMPLVTDFREDQFYKDIFTDKEISYCILQVDPRASFAGKFAAKEAIIKADNSYKKRSMKDIEVLIDNMGRPTFKDFSLSISHSQKQAIAIAIKSLHKSSNEDKKSKKKVLFIIDWYLPGYRGGGPTRSMANMAEYLIDFFDIFIVTRNVDYMKKVPYNTVKSDEWNRLPSGENVYYANEKKVSFGFYRNLFKIGKFDCVYIHGIYSWKFSRLPLLALKLTKHSQVIVAPRGMMADSAIGTKRREKKRFFKLAKISGLYRKVIFHATNDKEKNEIIRNVSSKNKIFIAENLPRKFSCDKQPINKKQGELRLVFIGRVAPEKNTLFAIEILSKLKKSDNLITCDIYGQVYDNEYWEACKKLIEKLPDNIRVQNKGTIVPEQLFDTIAKYHCLFLPTQGENFGHAILESLMVGRPVLISDQTPWIKLKEAKAGWDIALSKSEEFVKTIEMLAEMNSTEFNEWTDGALLFAKNYIKNSNSRIIDKYKRMFSSK
jgi:phosphopantetheine--protein transferase-like protein